MVGLYITTGYCRNGRTTLSDIGRFCMLPGVAGYIIMLVYFGSQMTGFGWLFPGFFCLLTYSPSFKFIQKPPWIIVSNGSEIRFSKITGYDAKEVGKQMLNRKGITGASRLDLNARRVHAG